MTTPQILFCLECWFPDICMTNFSSILSVLRKLRFVNRLIYFFAVKILTLLIGKKKAVSSSTILWRILHRFLQDFPCILASTKKQTMLYFLRWKSDRIKRSIKRLCSYNFLNSAIQWASSFGSLSLLTIIYIIIFFSA